MIWTDQVEFHIIYNQCLYIKIVKFKHKHLSSRDTESYPSINQIINIFGKCIRNLFSIIRHIIKDNSLKNSKKKKEFVGFDEFIY